MTTNAAVRTTMLLGAAMVRVGRLVERSGMKLHEGAAAKSDDRALAAMRATPFHTTSPRAPTAAEQAMIEAARARAAARRAGTDAG